MSDGSDPGRSNRLTTLATAFAGHGNNFDLMRLAAALLVLASHAYVLTGNAADEPVGRATAHMIDGGGVAVAMFFVLSGFLIARSAQVHPPAVYLRARMLRIYPDFLVAVLLQTLLLGPAVTTLPASAYLTDPAPWRALTRALLFSVPAGLPGVFEANPVAGIVNGSLWTLRVEAACYLGLLLVAMTGWLQRGRVLLPLAGAWALLAATLAPWRLPLPLAGTAATAIADCVLHFLMGAALWLYADRLPRSLVLAGAGAALLALAAPTRAAPVALHLVLPYLVLWLGLGRPLLRHGIADVSYGTYLYAFPVQQALVTALSPGIGPAGLVALAVPPVLLLAALSRRYIEDPALRLRRAAR